MPTQLGLLSLTQLPKQQQNETMWSYGGSIPPPPRAVVDEEDSWEVRAFAEDTNSAMGTTWPPRFYACTFCRREFRSAQALGGHMNVHRRDRARMQLRSNQPSSLAMAPPVIFSSSEHGGFCFGYPAPNPHGLARPDSMGSSSTFFSISDCNNTRVSNINFAAPGCTYDDSCLLEKTGSERCKEDEELIVEEVDLELRLGW